jgi:hypothetical protein
MLNAGCSRARRLLLQSEGRMLSAADGLWLENHLHQCEGCRKDGHDLGLLLDAWKTPTPPRLNTGQIERLIASTLDPAERAEAPEPRRAAWGARFAVLAAGTALAAVGIGALLWWFRVPPVPATSTSAVWVPAPPEVLPGLRVIDARGPVTVQPVSGASVPVTAQQEVAWGVPVTVGPRAVLRLRMEGDRVQVAVDAGSRIALHHRQRVLEVALSQGQVVIDVAPGRSLPLRVTLPAGDEVWVKGTRFAVTTRPGGGTSVSVLRGRVAYHLRRGREERVIDVEAGVTLRRDGEDVTRQPIGVRAEGIEALLAGREVPTAADATTDAAVPGGPADRAAAEPHPATRLACEAASLHTLIAQRRLTDARSRFADCGRAGRLTRELRILEAETELLAGNAVRAHSLYLDVARRHPDTLAGQNALFAAGQVALSRLGRRDLAASLFRRYLREYPRGVYRSDAERLLRER